jgi:protocatechuate 3,4-dioxygenase, alpha subunit
VTSLGRTPSQTVGPYFTIGLVREDQSTVVEGGSVRVIGRVLDGAGDPVPDAVVELWQRGEDGTRWGRSGTDAQGNFEFVTETPADGYADVLVFARGLLKHLATRCYFSEVDDPVLSALDPADRETLIAVPEDGALRFDIRLQGDRQTVFFAV